MTIRPSRNSFFSTKNFMKSYRDATHKPRDNLKQKNFAQTDASHNFEDELYNKKLSRPAICPAKVSTKREQKAIKFGRSLKNSLNWYYITHKIFILNN